MDSTKEQEGTEGEHVHVPNGCDFCRHTRDGCLAAHVSITKKKKKKLKINSQIIDRHSVSHSEFADDSQLYMIQFHVKN